MRTQSHYCNTSPPPDTCIPCPNNAICSPKNVIGCESSDYKLSKHYLSYILPFKPPFPFGQPSCVLDNTRIILEQKKQEKVLNLISKLDVIVRKWIGDVICGDVKSIDNFDWAFSKETSSSEKVILGMPLSLAKKKLNDLVKMDSGIFEEYWQMLIKKLNLSSDEDIGSIPLNTIVDEHSHTRRLLKTINRPIISTACNVRMEFWKILDRHAQFLIILGISILAIYFAVVSYSQHLHESEIIGNLVASCLDAVHSETENFHRDSTRHPLNGLPAIQLRDHFLPLHKIMSSSGLTSTSVDTENRRIYHLPKNDRDRIWKKVAQQVLKNSNVRESSLNVKGEVQIVWMWIGSYALSPIKKRRVGDDSKPVVTSEKMSTEDEILTPSHQVVESF